MSMQERGRLMKKHYTDEITIDIDSHAIDFRYYETKHGFHLWFKLDRPIEIKKHFRQRLLMHDDLNRIAFDISRYMKNPTRFQQRLFDEKQKGHEVLTRTVKRK